MLFAYSLIENLGYRQMTLIWRARGFISFIQKFHKIQADSEQLNASVDKIVKKAETQQRKFELSHFGDIS